MITVGISLKEARNLVVQSNFPDSQNKKTKNDLLNTIEDLSFVQIDTMSVVERSHHHILWSRMPCYNKVMLDELVSVDKSIFEYWSHAAAYIPMKHFRFSLIRKNNYRIRYNQWAKANKKIINNVNRRIRSEGELQSRNFEDQAGSSAGWWNWKPSKDALDFLFHCGKIMVTKRLGFQKVYDLTERVLPADVNTTLPSEKEFYQHLIESAVNSQAIVSEREIFYLRKYNRKSVAKLLNEMTEDGKLVSVVIKNLPGKYYSTQKKLELSKRKREFDKLHILSPFDNLIIQRKRTKDFFGFDFQIECYLPESKRKFGYFCLPIMHGDRFIGKFDAKADRAGKNFLVKKYFREGNAGGGKKMLRMFEKKVSELSEFTGCGNVKWTEMK